MKNSFLDEISNISKDVQAQLLRFLETREFLPLGGSKKIKVDIRLVFATNRKLEEMVKTGEFREDFYYRIYVYPIVIPVLNERKTDILPIAFYFLRQFCKKMGKKIKKFHENAAARLMEYNWPGNVRQLERFTEWLVLTHHDTDTTIETADLDRIIHGIANGLALAANDNLSGEDKLRYAVKYVQQHFPDPVGNLKASPNVLRNMALAELQKKGLPL